MPVRRMTRIVLLAALCIVWRSALVFLPNVKPVTAIFLVSLMYMSLEDSLLVMALTMLGSGILLGFGIVVFWQILSFAIILFLWRFLILPFTQNKLWLQMLLAGLSAMLYGSVIDTISAVQFGANLYIYWLNGFWFNMLHAVSTVLFYPIIYTLFRRFYK